MVLPRGRLPVAVAGTRLGGAGAPFLAGVEARNDYVGGNLPKRTAGEQEGRRLGEREGRQQTLSEYVRLFWDEATSQAFRRCLTHFSKNFIRQSMTKY